VRRALSYLTVRGRCVVAAGAAMLVVGVLLGERALAQLAVFLLALPLLSAGTVTRQRFRLSARRTVRPSRVPRGSVAEVLLELANVDARPGGLWMLTEQLPPDLGPAPQFVVDGLPAGATTTARYQVPGSRRGRHVLGPLRLRLLDPFGLVERGAVGADTASVVVVPRVLPLGPAGPSAGQGGGGEGTRRSIAVHGEDDVSTREYRHGDDLRKVHWRATARTGELMVRLEERPWRAQATLLLDTRARAHVIATRTSHRSAPVPGPPGDECPPPDSLEWLLEAAASIGTTLAGRGAVLRTVTDVEELTPDSGRGRLGPEDLLDRLATLRPSRGAGLKAGIELLCRAAGDGPVVCLLGAVGPEDVVELIRGRSGPTTDSAVLMDLGSWVDTGAAGPRRGLSATVRSALDDEREAAAALLLRAGWRVAVARADRSVSDVWQSLGGTGSAEAAGAQAFAAAGGPVSGAPA
jgi:uncharacterized protein (DUF58 family)